MSKDGIALELIQARNIIKLNKQCIDNQYEQIKGLQHYCKILQKKIEKIEIARRNVIIDKQKLIDNLK